MQKKLVWLLYDADTSIGIECQCLVKTISDIRRKSDGDGQRLGRCVIEKNYEKR